MNSKLDKTTEDVTKIAKEVAEAYKNNLNNQYTECAEAFSDIISEIHLANSRTIQWLNRFRYIDLDDKQEFDILIQDYHKLADTKVIDIDKIDTSGYRQLKWSCSKIKKKYDKHIQPYIKDLLSNNSKVDEAHYIFTELATGDEKMKAYVNNQILEKLDDFVKQIEPEMEAGNIQGAKLKKLQFRQVTQDTIDQLKKMDEDLDNLALEFYNIEFNNPY